MKILVLSDLNWHQNSKKIGRKDIIKLFETKDIGAGDRFLTVNKYWSIINSKKPELILFAGDVTGDGSCGHGYHTAFYYLLSLIELSGLPACFIKGDNDLDAYYKQVTDNIHQYDIQEISGHLVSVSGINIYGLSFQDTNSENLPLLLDKLKDRSIDIVLCHCELKRRTSLFAQLNVGLIITGHFDNKICNANGIDFISHSNDSHIINYSTIDYKSPDNVRYNYHFVYPERRLDINYSTTKAILQSGNLEESDLIVNDVPVDIKEYEDMALPNSAYEKEKNALALSVKFLKGQAYTKAITYMIGLKAGKNIDKKELAKLMKKQITARNKLSKTMLVDFLGHKMWKYFKK